MDSFVHEAVVSLTGRSTSAAPGGAVTVALCGHWEHDGPCTWPHHTAVVGLEGSRVTLRIEFSCADTDEPAVRRLVRGALESEVVAGPDGPETWTLLDERVGV